MRYLTYMARTADSVATNQRILEHKWGLMTRDSLLNYSQSLTADKYPSHSHANLIPKSQTYLQSAQMAIKEK